MTAHNNRSSHRECPLRLLSDERLQDAYESACRLQLDLDFIILLSSETIRRRHESCLKQHPLTESRQ
jgi:hypothetical protein